MKHKRRLVPGKHISNDISLQEAGVEKRCFGINNLETLQVQILKCVEELTHLETQITEASPVSE